MTDEGVPFPKLSDAGGGVGKALRNSLVFD